jgi:sulfur transfer protein SufE
MNLHQRQTTFIARYSILPDPHERLAAALCELYDDAEPQEILDEEPELFEALGIAANLSPTRLNGLAQLRGRIVEFARSQLA